LSIWECPDCRLVFNVISQQNEFDARSYYSADYYDERKDYYTAEDASRKSFREKVESFHAGLDLLERYKSSRGRILDVGCGFGTFLIVAKERGWDISGIDISEHAASVASKRAGIKVLSGELRDAGFRENEFDAVCFNDAFEHFVDPNEQLQHTYRILKSDGVLFLNTPNQQALLRLVADLMYRLSAGTITYPVRKLYHEFHLFYYSEDNLRKALEKNGFETLEIIRKTIPAIKARGTQLERLIVRFFSQLERLAHREYELLAVARKRK
jgi:2-polyprenyl-3-methyl-5-hydroxy-6-metoxy-1,4-benzoquinol methylase